MRINLNKLAKEITLQEGGKQNISIAQVKEVMKILFSELALYRPSDVLKVIERYE